MYISSFDYLEYRYFIEENEAFGNQIVELAMDLNFRSFSNFSKGESSDAEERGCGGNAMSVRGKVRVIEALSYGVE